MGKHKNWYYNYKLLSKVTGQTEYQLRHAQSRGEANFADLESMIWFCLRAFASRNAKTKQKEIRLLNQILVG